MKKQCSKCRIKKNISCFHRNKRQKDGYHYYCKICKAQNAHENYIKHKEKELERCYKWRKAKKGKLINILCLNIPK